MQPSARPRTAHKRCMILAQSGHWETRQQPHSTTKATSAVLNVHTAPSQSRHRQERLPGLGLPTPEPSTCNVMSHNLKCHTWRCSSVKPLWVPTPGCVISVCVLPRLTAPNGILKACTRFSTYSGRGHILG